MDSPQAAVACIAKSADDSRMERLCINCKHFRREYSAGSGPYYADKGYDLYCAALNGKVNQVTGDDVGLVKADFMRMTACGWSDPKFFEPK